MTLTADQLHLLKYGNGPHIIMMHGWGRSLNDIKPVADVLAEYATVHVIDLPGFGKTPPPPAEGWDTNQYAELILDYIRKQNLDKVILLGHSFGGRVSLRISAKHPELVSKLILIDSHGLRPIRTLYQNLRVQCIKKAAKIVKLIDKTFGLKLYAEKFAKRFGSADYQNAGVLKNTFVKTISEDQTSDVEKIRAKTLLLWGSEDQDTPVAMGQKFHQLIKDSKLIVLEGKGHSPFHGVGAHLCASHIIKFLQS